MTDVTCSECSTAFTQLGDFIPVPCLCWRCKDANLGADIRALVKDLKEEIDKTSGVFATCLVIDAWAAVEELIERAA